MEKKLEELQTQSDEQAKEYFEFIKTSVADKSYFKDAFDWYCFRYISPICDRTLLIFGAMIAAVVLFFLIVMIEGTFPLVERTPIIVEAKDQSKFFPNLIELKPKKESVGYDSQIRTVDEAVAKYLVSFYVKTREGFDFSKAEVEDVNKKFNYIKNTSSESEFRNFQLVMDRENPESPINFFGQDVKKIINIESVRFIRNSASLVSQRFQDFFSNKIPTEVEVRYTAITRTIDDDGNPKEVKAGYLAKMNFVFLGVKRDNQKDLKFNVNNYKLFKVK